MGGITELLADCLTVGRDRLSIEALTEEIGMFIRVAFEGGLEMHRKAVNHR